MPVSHLIKYFVHRKIVFPGTDLSKYEVWKVNVKQTFLPMIQLELWESNKMFWLLFLNSNQNWPNNKLRQAFPLLKLTLWAHLGHIFNLFSSNSPGLVAKDKVSPWVIYWTGGNCGKSFYVNLLLYMVTVFLITAHLSLHLISSHLSFPPTLSCQMDI